MRPGVALSFLVIVLFLTACAKTTSDVAHKVAGPQDAVDAVFSQYGHRKDLRSFPRRIGIVEGMVGVGGPAPGHQVPATYETSALTAQSGAYEVTLVRRFQRNNQDEVTIWTFLVPVTGKVEDVGRKGSNYAEIAG